MVNSAAAGLSSLLREAVKYLAHAGEGGERRVSSRPPRQTCTSCVPAASLASPVGVSLRCEAGHEEEGEKLHGSQGSRGPAEQKGRRGPEVSKPKEAFALS